jgi:hypothetical protein
MPHCHPFRGLEKPRAPAHARAAGPGERRPADRHSTQETSMAKGLNQKKTEKKKPEKTLKEKRAEKAAKKSGKG